MAVIDSTPAGTAAGGAPALSAVAPRIWLSAALYLAAAALLLRFYDLPLKPLHHDEGVNTLLLSSLLRPPHAFRYDPSNYHGPTLFYAAWLSTFLLGVTTVAVRAVTATAGLATVLLLLGLRHRVGTVGALAAATLLAVSPGAVYFSRYFIHEMLLVCFTVGVVVGISNWMRDGRRGNLLLAAASAGLMFATKETAIISAVVLGAALAGAAWLVRVRQSSATVVTSTLQLLRDWIDGLRGLAANRAARPGAGAAVVVFLLVNAAFYTSFFTHGQGAIDAVRTFAFWTRTGTSNHVHPWFTYLSWLGQEETPLLIAGGAGAALALWRSSDRFAVFVALWTIGTIAAYSLIPYKTPWLALNMVVPLALAGGYSAERIWQGVPAGRRRWLWLAAVPLLGIALYQSIRLNFVRYDDEGYPYVYAHTNREVLGLVDEIRRLSARHPSVSIAITSPEHFPLSWYLRDQRAGYYGKEVATNDPLVVASEDQAPAMDALLGPAFVKLGVYRLRPGVRLVLYARRDLLDGRGR
jgi:uncharacterized protein (TIGR03663 family)